MTAFLTGARPELIVEPLCAPNFLGRGISDHGTLGALPIQLRGHKFPWQDSNLHLPLSRRSNRSLHHRPNPTFQELAGEPTRRADSGHEFSRYLVLRHYAPVPGTLIPGRVAAPRVVIGAKYLSSSPPANPITSLGTCPVEQRGHDWPALSQPTAREHGSRLRARTPAL